MVIKDPNFNNRNGIQVRAIKGMIDRVLAPKNDWYSSLVFTLANIMGDSLGSIPLVNTYDRRGWPEWVWVIAYYLYHIRPF